MHAVAKIQSLEQVAPPDVVARVGRALALTDGVASLLPLDRLMIAALIECRMLEIEHLPRGKQINLRHLDTCLNHALDLVMRADKHLAVEAGLLGRLAYHQHDWQPWYENRVSAWVDLCVGLPLPSETAKVEKLDQRRRTLLSILGVLTHHRVVSGKRLLERMEDGLRLAARKRRDSKHQVEQETEKASLPSKLWILIHEHERVERLVKVEHDGLLSLGSRAVRDSQSLAQREPDGAEVELDAPAGRAGEGSRSKTMVNPDAIPAPRHAAAREALDAVNDYLNAAFDKAKPGSARGAVLERMIGLGLARLQLLELADATGLSSAALCEARAKINAELEALPAVRDLCHGD